MPRQARPVVPGQLHHVTQRGNRRTDVFFDGDDRLRYRDLLQECSEPCGVTVPACCLMTNHVHLVAVPREERCLTQALRTAHCGLRTDPLVSGELPDGVAPGVWQAHLAEPVTGEGVEHLRSRTQSGLPCGDEGFLSRVSKLVRRALVVRGRGRPRKPEGGDESAK